jgi:hypothetical protein
MIDKFPDTGINQLEAQGRAYSPAEWPAATDFVRAAVKIDRDAAIRGHESIHPIEAQQFVVSKIAMPAIADTVAQILEISNPLPKASSPYIDLLDQRGISAYYGDPGAGTAIGGVYYPSRNQILINTERRSTDSPEDLANFAKVFLHEYFHFLSSQYSRINSKTLTIQRVGVMALGEDIREKSQGELTWDYFLSFNEALTEMLAIKAREKIINDPIFKRPDGTQAPSYTTYHGYRHLTNKVLEDSIRYGATDMSKDEVFNFVARGYLMGELKPLIELVRATYPGLSMREFGLMTKASELPKESDFVPVPPDDGGGGGWTLSDVYLNNLRDHLNGKPRSAYVTDAPSGPKRPPQPPTRPPTPLTVRLRRDIQEHRHNKVRYAQFTPGEDGMFYDRNGEPLERDENGNIIHYDQSWLVDTLTLVIGVAKRLQNGEVSLAQASQAMDAWLFEIQHISELSSGFEKFYVTKHELFEAQMSAQDFANRIEEVNQQANDLRMQYRK